MHNEPVKHDKPHPVAASAGADNAYYLRGCPVVERSPAYAACLYRLHEADAGRETELNRQCAGAIRQGRCIAHGMREAEQLAGVALYYFPRLAKPFLPVKTAGDFGVLVTNHTDPALIPKAPAPKPKPAPKVDAGSYADAINAALATKPVTMEEIKQAVATIPPEQLPPLLPKMLAPSDDHTIQPGETPLQYARRMAALRTSTN